MTEFTEVHGDDLLVTLTADIVSAHVANNSIGISEIAGMIANVHGALAGLSVDKVIPVEKQEPAVSVRSSVKPDYIICLEDGKKLKMLKRHLMTHYQMTPADYRAKWNLPSDYPMVSPNYAQQRKELALKIGLGSKAGAVVAKVAPKGRAKLKVAVSAE
ncbi:MAG TPA: MucR family transcriptional regulator [Sphingobium sp.]